MVRLPCIVWVNSGSLFILEIQRRSFNDSTCLQTQCKPLGPCKAPVPISFGLDARTGHSLGKKSILAGPARMYANDAVVTLASLLSTLSIPNIVA